MFCRMTLAALLRIDGRGSDTKAREEAEGTS